MTSFLRTMINALLPADADAAVGAKWGQPRVVAPPSATAAAQALARRHGSGGASRAGAPLKPAGRAGEHMYRPAMAGDDPNITSDEPPRFETESVGDPLDEDEFKLPPFDWSLSELVDTINGSQGEIAVILTLSGMIVYGNLVSGHRFFEPKEAMFRELVPETPADEGKAHVTELIADDFLHTAKSFAQHEGPATHIHLEPATVMMGAVKLNLTHWRGRLSEVSGWTSGSIGGPGS